LLEQRARQGPGASPAVLVFGVQRELPVRQVIAVGSRGIGRASVLGLARIGAGDLEGVVVLSLRTGEGEGNEEGKEGKGRSACVHAAIVAIALRHARNENES